MRIFITGASGFVGGAAAKRLVADGHAVTAMSRSEASDSKIKALGATPVRADLETIKSTDLVGAEIVIHAAAFVEAWGPKDAWDKINVGGTKRMLAAAKAAGVRRFIHIGTEAALVRGQDIRNGDENLPLAFDSPYPYCRTKALAEQAVRTANAPGFETIVLRPRFIWGPGDQTILPTVRAMAESGGWMWVNEGKAKTSTIHIDNLTDAIVLSLSKGRPGEAYFILDDGERTIRDIIGGMASAIGVNLPDNSIPRWVADMIGGVSEAAWRTLPLKGAPPLTRHAAMVMSRDCTLKGDKARVDLGYTPRVSVAQGLAGLRNS